MRMTFALGTSPTHSAIVNEIKPNNILVAFPYAKALDTLTYKPEYVMTDSGAFTAWNVGKKVDIGAYADWAISQAAKFPRVISVNLDVIPGEKGRTSTEKERIEGMKQSIKNADYLRARGINVMEVFHQDEPKEFLNELVDRLPKGGVLGISPRNDKHLKAKVEWQQVVMRSLIEKCGKENLPRTHGLAVTSIEMLRNFPYYSGDSSTWVNPFRYGGYVDERGRIVGIDTIMSKRPSGSESNDALHFFARESIYNLIRVGDSMTTLWGKRGINWED